MQRISPISDLGFKKVLASEDNKDILAGLIKDFFGIKEVIVYRIFRAVEKQNRNGKSKTLARLFYYGRNRNRRSVIHQKSRASD